MRRFRLALRAEGAFRAARRIEERKDHGRWRQWCGPFEEVWLPGMNATALVGRRITRVIDGYGHVHYGATAQSVYA